MVFYVRLHMHEYFCRAKNEIKAYALCYFTVDDVLRATLSIYMEDHVRHPLPTSEEVLVCTPATTAEEV